MAPERIADRYDVVREVGRGASGAVYLCEDTTLGRQVAIKRVGGLPGESTPHLARALREARSSAALHHPNVVAIYDAIEEGGHVWLVMEYVPSRTLHQLASNGPLEPTRVAAIGAQVAEALAAAHDRGTIHRDVKPGNILVTDDDIAKISDFGIARTAGDDQLTQTGMVSGTPLYFSPALARGAEPAPADDVWALGASLFAAVEGRAPWPSMANSLAMLVHIADNPPPTPQRAGPLGPVISRMMDVDPQTRPTMAEAAQALRAVADDRGDDAPTAVLAAPGAAAATAPVTPVPPTAPPTPLADEPATTTPPPEDPGRRRRLIALLVAAAVLAIALTTAVLIGLDDDGTDTARTPDEDRSAPPSAEPTGGSDRTPDDGAAEPDPEEPAADATDDAAEEPNPDSSTPTDPEAGGDAGQVVQDYYALLPGDTRAAWDVLGEAMRSSVGSYEDYAAFWATIDAVRVDGVEETGDGTVRVDLTYTSGGGTESETREITVDDGLIVADGVV